MEEIYEDDTFGKCQESGIHKEHNNEKTKKSIKKWAKIKNRRLSIEDQQMSNNHVNGHSTSLSIVEIKKKKNHSTTLLLMHSVIYLQKYGK